MTPKFSPTFAYLALLLTEAQSNLAAGWGLRCVNSVLLWPLLRGMLQKGIIYGKPLYF